MAKRRGRKSAAQTPAPKADKIKGSKKNPKGSAASEKSAASIKLSSGTIDTLKKKLDEFKEKYPSKKNVSLNDLKAVYRRGSGAYSKSHRPTITGGKPNSRAAWSFARVNKFLEKAAGKKVKAAYVQDDDLLKDGGKVFNDQELLAKWKRGESIGFTAEAHLKAKGLIPRADGKKKKSEKYLEQGGDIFAKGGGIKGKGNCYQAAGDFAIGKFFAPQIDFIGEPYIVHAEVRGQGQLEGIRYGHAWVEDDENVYDHSNGREIRLPKQIYYLLGDIKTDDPKKYRKYTFAEARKKMLDTGTYGCWDIETDYKDGGETDTMVQCVKCDWTWSTADSDESDKYVCHKCGFDNSLFYDTDILKPTLSISEIAEKHGVELDYVIDQLMKGTEHEMEHTNRLDVAKKIALHHVAETPDYYEKLEQMKLEDGGMVSISDEDYEFSVGGEDYLGKAIKENGIIVGGIAYNDEDQEIQGISIKNKFRKKGIAKKAVKKLFDNDKNLEAVYVRSVPKSKKFWEKIGTDFDSYNDDAGLWEGTLKRYEDGGELEEDLFENIESLPAEVQQVLSKYSLEDETYENMESMIAELEPLGYTFEYGLDATPYGLKKIEKVEVISEDNSVSEIEISEYLMQQRAEAQDVMHCNDSRIFKTMICKTKIEISEKRLSETDNPEEQNVWNECINIWSDCMNDILENNIQPREYKDGGSPCDCGTMYEKGGLAYGNSHDKGGIPLEVSSTGQKIEIEGGEGVVNKRSMQSTKKVEFEGKKLTPCEVVSKINEMGGGVKFKCSDVKEIIAEDGHF